MVENDKHSVATLTRLIEDWEETDRSDLRQIVVAIVKHIETHENELLILKQRYDLETNIGLAALEAAFKGPILKKKE